MVKKISDDMRFLDAVLREALNSATVRTQYTPIQIIGTLEYLKMDYYRGVQDFYDNKEDNKPDWLG